MVYTNTVKDFDFWMHDDANPFTSSSIPKKGWDVEFAKPGVLQLLKQFKKHVEDMDEVYEIGEFNYE